GRTACGYSECGLWHVGLICPFALHARSRRAVPVQHIRPTTSDRRTIPAKRYDDRQGYADGWRSPDDHDSADDIIDLPRDRGSGSTLAKRRHVSTRRNEMGNAAVGDFALCAWGNYRRGDAWISACVWRDDGGNNGHW